MEGEERTELVNTELTDSLRKWIELDDEARRLGERLKEIRTEKTNLGGTVLSFMRENELDDFKLEGMTGGSLSRSVRTFKPAIKRNTIRTQLLIHFGDQPTKVSEALRAIEGIAEGEDAMSVGVQKELLTRRLPRKPRNQSAIQLNG
jgi:hypothetical protein